MAKPKPPQIAPEEIPKTPRDELERFLSQLYFRTLNSTTQLESGKLNKAWIALETLGAIFPALDAGLSHDEAKSAYPFPSWREDTVEVPVAVLRVIVESWNRYHVKDHLTFGQAFGFEHVNRQGRRPMKQTANTIDKQLGLAGQVEARYRQIKGFEARSLAEVVAEVAEENGVSDTTVERAYSRFREQIDRNIGKLDLWQEIDRRTSRSGALDD